MVRVVPLIRVRVRVVPLIDPTPGYHELAAAGEGFHGSGKTEPPPGGHYQSRRRDTGGYQSMQEGHRGYRVRHRISM